MCIGTLLVGIAIGAVAMLFAFTATFVLNPATNVAKKETEE